MKYLKLLSLHCILSMIFILNANDNKQLQKDLKNLQTHLTELNAALQKISSTPIPPPWEAISPDFLKTFAQLTPEQQQKLVDYIEHLKSGAIPEVPPPPPPGSPPPPPPPPPPSRPTKPSAPKVPIFLPGLTDEEIRIKSEDLKKSNDYLQLKISNLGISKNYSSLKEVNKDITRMINDLGSQIARESGFVYSKDSSPEKLLNALTQFVNKLANNKNILQEVTQGLQNGTLQRDIFNIFEPWVFGNKAEFLKKVNTALEGVVINISAVIRMTTGGLEQFPEDQPGNQQQSDVAFIMCFTHSSNKEEARTKINRLRVDPRYLKFKSLQEDMPIVGISTTKAPTAPVVGKAPTREELEEQLKKMHERKEKPKEKAKPTAVEGILVFLGKKKGTVQISSITPDYLTRYLYNPTLFKDSGALKQLSNFMSVVIVKKTERIDIDTYITSKLPKDVTNVNDLLEFATAFSRQTIQEQMNFTWRKITKKTTKTYSSSELQALKKQLVSLKPGEFGTTKDALITSRSIPVAITIPNKMITQIVNWKNQLEKILQEPSMNKRSEKLIRVFTARYSSLESWSKSLSLNQALYDLVKTVDEATTERK